MPSLTGLEYLFLGVKLTVALSPIWAVLLIMFFARRRNPTCRVDGYGVAFAFTGLTLISGWFLWMMYDEYLVEPPPPFELTANSFRCAYWDREVPWRFFTDMEIANGRHTYSIRLKLHPAYAEQGPWNDYVKKTGVAICSIDQFRERALAQYIEVRSAFLHSRRLTPDSP